MERWVETRNILETSRKTCLLYFTGIFLMGRLYLLNLDITANTAGSSITSVLIWKTFMREHDAGLGGGGGGQIGCLLSG
jgi:hypothetical protein